MSEESTGADGQTHRTHLVSYSSDMPSLGGGCLHVHSDYKSCLMIFLCNLHVIANFWFCTGASRHSNKTDGAQDDALGIYNEHILYGHV